MAHADDIRILWQPAIGAWTSPAGAPGCAKGARTSITIGSSITFKFNGAALAVEYSTLFRVFKADL